MNRHKHLARLERLKDAIWKRYGRRGVLDESCFPDGGVWAIWLGLLRDIRECGLSYSYKIDGVRLYYYNELWKMVNGKDHAPLDTPPKFKNTNSTVVRYKGMEFTDTMDRAEWIAKEPLSGYIWTEAK